VRVWLESGHDEGLRARVTTTEFATNEQTEMYAASVDEILAIVRTWVEAFAEPA
jgi:hypothetical protein